MTFQKRSYTAGHFELAIDGHPSTAYLKSIDGGHPRGTPVSEPFGSDLHQAKHISVVEVEPITFEFGMSGADDVLKVIQASWRKQYARMSGQVTHANFDLQATLEHEFFDALICETTFPSLDGSSKDAAYLKVKMQPESAVIRTPSGNNTIQSNYSAKQKMWLPSGFRFNLEGLDSMKYTNKIESFAIKQGVKRHMTGDERFGECTPTKIEFPNISGTISMEFAGPLMKWAAQYLTTGQRDTAAQRSGSIEFLSPDRSETIFSINLFEVGVVYAAPVSSGAESIKRVKFELYVGRMDIDGKGMLAMS
jgi:hypothetical protein